MFKYHEQNNERVIQLTRGDSVKFVTCPRTNNINYVTLYEGDYVLFTVGSYNNNNARRYVEKIISKDNYDERGGLVVELSPDDTKDMRPMKYKYSLAYMPQSGTEYHTYETGVLDLLPAISTIDVMKELLSSYDEDDTSTEGDASGDASDENGIGG